jgi:hypothetical protein
MTQTLHWDRGRLARTSAVRHADLATDLTAGGLFALRAHGGRDARGPSEELELLAQRRAILRADFHLT